MVLVDYLKYLTELLSKYIPDEIVNYIPASIITRTVLIGTTTGILVYLIVRKRYHLPPGPFALPLVGNSYLFSQGNLPKELFELSKKYGPVFKLYMGPSMCVVLNNIESINEALLKRGAHFSDRMKMYAFDQMLHNSEDIALSRYGTAWKLRRKIAARAIRLFMMQGNLNVIVADAVSKTVTAMLKEKDPFDPKPYLFYTTLNILAAMCFDTSYEYSDPEYWNLLTLMEENSEVQSGIVFENVISIFAKVYTSSRYRKLDFLMKKFLLFVDNHVESHKAKFIPGNIRDFTDSMLQAEKEISDEGQDNMADFKDIHVKLTVFDIFFAGNDTSRLTLYWALMYIIGVPGVQKKLQQEVDSAIGRDRYPTTADRDNLPYTNAVLHEVMRMGMVVPLGVPHSTTCDTKLGEFDIPKKTTVFINHWALHNDPSCWDEVNKFKPERFLDEDGKMAPKPENWLPFSAGRRVCLGEPLAKPELHLILAALFQRLEFSHEPGKPLNMAPKATGFTYSPHPYNIVVTKRN